MKKTTTTKKQDQSDEGTENKIARKKIEIISDSGSRDDDDAGDYDETYTDESRKDSKGSLYNSDENKEFQQRGNDYRKGDKNQLNTQRNSSNRESEKDSSGKSVKTKSVKSK